MTGSLKLQTEVIEKWLKLNNWTRQQFADVLEVTPEFVSMLLSGKRFPSMNTLEAICRITGLDSGTIMVFDRNSANSSKES